MIIECPYCESKVNARVLAEHDSIDEEIGPFKVSFVECPVCKDSLVGFHESIQTGPDSWDYDDAIRVWPEPEKYSRGFLPEIVANSIDQAKKCFKAQAYDACAVMCGRTLEGICTEFNTKHKNLRDRLKELLEKQVIDKRIYDWGEALIAHRNIGAHATLEKITKEDARYLLDFAEAICEYVFILTEKFERFMQSKKKSKASQSQ